MIKVQFIGDGYIHVTGHAGAAPHGKDIVCAGVSSLVCSLLANLIAEGIEPIDASVEPGDVEIRCRPTRKAKRLFRYFRIGITRFAEDYSEFVLIV